MAVSRTSADHAEHDELMLAVLASGDDLPAEDLARVETRLRDCAECSLVLADLRAIRAATSDLPAPPRRRDFRLTEDDVVRLRPSFWRRLLEAFGSPRDRVSAPAAAGLATLGIAGLLLVSLGQVGGGMNVAAPASTAVDGVPAAGAYSTESGSAPEAVGGAAPAADQMTTRTGQAGATEEPGAVTKMAPVAPDVTAGPAANAQPAEGAGGAATAAPGATEGPAVMALPLPSDAAAQASAAPEAAQLAQPAESPVPTAAPAPASAPDQGLSQVAIIALLSIAAIAAAIVLAAFRFLGRRLASADGR